MDTAMVVDLGRESLYVAVLIAAPMLGIALAVGLLIGIVQAATSINEMTLSFIPKLAALVIVLMVLGVMANFRPCRFYSPSFRANSYVFHVGV